MVLLINASEKEACPCINAYIPDGKYEVSGDAKASVEVVDGEFTVNLPPLSVSYIIL